MRILSSVINLKSPRKILVIGSGGAGKSTFARRLSEILGIDVVHLDALYWKPGWVEPSKEEWAETVRGSIETRCLDHGWQLFRDSGGAY